MRTIIAFILSVILAIQARDKYEEFQRERAATKITSTPAPTPPTEVRPTQENDISPPGELAVLKPAEPQKAKPAAEPAEPQEPDEPSAESQKAEPAAAKPPGAVAKPPESRVESGTAEVMKKLDRLDARLTELLSFQKPPESPGGVESTGELQSRLRNMELYLAELIRWKRGEEPAEKSTARASTSPAMQSRVVSPGTIVSGGIVCDPYTCGGYR